MGFLGELGEEDVFSVKGRVCDLMDKGSWISKEIVEIMKEMSLNYLLFCILIVWIFVVGSGCNEFFLILYVVL